MNLTKHPLYSTWINMKLRHKTHICQKWNDFFCWLNEVIIEIGDKPEGSIFSRIDKNKNFESGNIQWKLRIKRGNFTNAERCKERNERLKLQGICKMCAKAPAREGLVTCLKCGDKSSKAAIKFAKKKNEEGLCKCGKPLINKTECVECQKYHKERDIIKRKKYREACFEAYGGTKCNCCGETRKWALSFDHIVPIGKKGRKELHRGEHLSTWLYLHNFPEGYQVLCMNCQFGRKHNKGICPHKLEKP